jgi:hypothetical protein
MLASLADGVQGGIDKVYRPATLEPTWEAVRRDGGAAGVDRVSVERFEAAHERLLGELGDEPKNRRIPPTSYQKSRDTEGPWPEKAPGDTHGVG